MAITVTKLSPHQMEEITSLIHQEEQMLNLTVKDIEKIFQEQRGLAAVDQNGTAVGFIKFISCGKSLTLDKHVFEIGSWIVVSTHRGQGVGKQLFLAMIKHINQLNEKTLIVDVTRKNNIETYEILKKLGAKKIPKPDCLTLYPKDMSEEMFYFFDVTHLAEQQNLP